MSQTFRDACCSILFASTLLVAGLATGQDWPRYRGPESNGSICGEGALDREPLGLELIWKRPLGSGYSCVLIAKGFGVTMFTDGSDDLLTAFDPETGKELWRYRIATMYQGHTGSENGPTSTPTISDGTVYGLGPHGHLFAVQLADGQEIWSRTLSETDSRRPKYGFTTVPLVSEDLVIVQTGGPDGHSISAFARDTGEVRWSLGDDTVQYQSPALLELGGRRQLVAITDRYLMGIAPEKGALLWRHEHKLQIDEGYNLPMLLGENRLVLTSVNQLVTLEVNDQTFRPDTALGPKERWHLQTRGTCFALPVSHEGYLYTGVRRRFLQCVNADTGEIMWKSRAAGGEGLIIVDGQLVMLSLHGDLVIIDASPKGYREKARLKVFERGGLTTPTFANGRVYLRNLSELAAVRISETPNHRADQERELLGQLGDFVRRAEATEGPQQLVEELLDAQESFPIIEGQDLVHFIYQGEVQDVAVTGNFLPILEERVMDRIAGTDVYFKSIRLDPEAVYDYQLSIDFGSLIPDPRNPHGITTLNGPGSILRMPLSKVPLKIEEVDELHRGRLESFQLSSRFRGNKRQVQVYLPNGYDAAAPDVRYPVLLVTYGLEALSAGYLDRWLDRLILERLIEPVIAVFFQEAGCVEFSGPNAEDLLRMLTEELIPHVDAHYRTIPDPDSRAILGLLDGGEFAVWGAFKAPGFYHKIALQSIVYVQHPAVNELPALTESVEQQPLELLFEIRRNYIEGEGIDYIGNSRTLIQLLENAGYKVEKREVPGSWGWSSWRAQYGEILQHLFPPQPAAAE